MSSPCECEWCFHQRTTCLVAGAYPILRVCVRNGNVDDDLRHYVIQELLYVSYKLGDAAGMNFRFAASALHRLSPNQKVTDPRRRGKGSVLAMPADVPVESDDVFVMPVAATVCSSWDNPEDAVMDIPLLCLSSHQGWSLRSNRSMFVYPDTLQALCDDGTLKITEGLFRVEARQSQTDATFTNSHYAYLPGYSLLCSYAGMGRASFSVPQHRVVKCVYILGQHCGQVVSVDFTANGVTQTCCGSEVAENMVAFDFDDIIAVASDGQDVDVDIVVHLHDPTPLPDSSSFDFDYYLLIAHQ